MESLGGVALGATAVLLASSALKKSLKDSARRDASCSFEAWQEKTLFFELIVSFCDMIWLVLRRLEHRMHTHVQRRLQINETDRMIQTNIIQIYMQSADIIIYICIHAERFM